MENGKDYVQVAIDYAQRAVDDEARTEHGRWVRLAAKRFLSDLERAETCEGSFVFSAWHATDACDFIEKLQHVEGSWELPTIVLDPFQVFFLVQLFGFRREDNPDARRYSHALLGIGRKNGKSALASGILLYVYCCEAENGPQIYTAAPTYDKASIVWGVSKKMIERDPELAEAFGLHPMAKAIVNYASGGTYKPIHSKASTQDGLNPSAVCMDEMHALPNHDLLNVLTSAAGARANPLWLYVTTEGYLGTGPWVEQRDFAKSMLQGAVVAEHYLAVVYAIDDEDDELDETVWVKANPLVQSNQKLLDAIRKEALLARHMPGTMAEFRTKRCNRPSQTATGWIDLAKWRDCSGPVDLDALIGHPCWAALDLSSTTDTTALAMVWRVDGEVYARTWYWVPEDQVEQRNARGTVKYAPWIEAGHMMRTPGPTVRLDLVEQFCRALFATHPPVAVGYDPWRATEIVTRLSEPCDDDGHDGYAMVQFPQQPKYFQPALDELETTYLAQRLHHGGNPVLQWHAANLILRRDVNGNGAPDKRKSAEKIDGMVALLMAVGLMLTEAPEGQASVYESRGIVSL